MLDKPGKRRAHAATATIPLSYQSGFLGTHRPRRSPVRCRSDATRRNAPPTGFMPSS